VSASSRSPLLAPPRMGRPSPVAFVVLVLFAALFLHALAQANVTPQRVTRGAAHLGSFLSEAFPPDLSRIGPISWAMFETFEMAIAGVTFGVLLSLPIALLAASNTTPHWMVRGVVRLLVACVRTVPDLVWALIFVVAVGLGPFAGILAIVMDTIGFCARFFSERIEEVGRGPSEALTSTGAARSDVVIGAILPEAFPSFTATSLYAVEKAVRSAVVLGLVGAGGIGVELSASMDLFRYDQALTIILMILAVVIGVEQISSRIRQRVL